MHFTKFNACIGISLLVCQKMQAVTNTRFATTYMTYTKKKKTDIHNLVVIDYVICCAMQAVANMKFETTCI